ncbi:hypothetical protein PoB_000937200 [Plakobranchus ocellatus]|uniref:Uncharacterized protein n=1 Tax=Plakobranchus ocellatus TaxID=259542 RepID=A0AAV3YL46_9GAST|nr:hypothetical protein PoB_000937200 [Plakobranchus ocellatus]
MVDAHELTQTTGVLQRRSPTHLTGKGVGAEARAIVLGDGYPQSGDHGFSRLVISEMVSNLTSGVLGKPQGFELVGVHQAQTKMRKPDNGFYTLIAGPVTDLSAIGGLRFPEQKCALAFGKDYKYRV